MAFRSGLEERIADLLVELGVKYEYESTKVPSDGLSGTVQYNLKKIEDDVRAVV